MYRYWLILGFFAAVAALIFVESFILLRSHLDRDSSSLEIATSTLPLHLLFVGDIMLDRGVAEHARAVGDDSLLQKVKNLLRGYDAVIANLEGTITTQTSVADKRTSLHFTFDPRFADMLAGVGVSAVSLANNHSLDFGASGYQQTRDFLDAAGVGSFGSPYNDQYLAVSVTLRHKAVCLVGYHALFNPDYSAILAKLSGIQSQCGYRIVFAHWGEEYQHASTTQQQVAAHAFIDAGADVVIGSHPHVVQPVEIYKNHAIFYSLGNFLFDQNFSPDVMRGLALDIGFEASSTRFTFIPVSTYKEVAVADASTTRAVLKDLGVVDNYIELAR